MFRVGIPGWPDVAKMYKLNGWLQFPSRSCSRSAKLKQI